VLSISPPDHGCPCRAPGDSDDEYLWSSCRAVAGADPGRRGAWARNFMPRLPLGKPRTHVGRDRATHDLFARSTPFGPYPTVTLWDGTRDPLRRLTRVGSSRNMEAYYTTLMRITTISLISLPGAPGLTWLFLTPSRPTIRDFNPVGDSFRRAISQPIASAHSTVFGLKEPTANPS
jgi:hypothetical protein